MKDKEPSTKIYLTFCSLIFVFFLLFWLYNNFFVEPGSESFNYFSDSYTVMALFGAISGFLISKKWGGLQSIMGKSIIFFSSGLLFQALGQLTYTIYFYCFKIDAPYPSFGDFFYFGSIPLYIAAISNLGKASGIKVPLKKTENILISLLIIFIMLTFSYFFFLQGYEFDWSNPLVVFLDFAYPLGQALYVALTVLIYYLSRSVLGGIMRNKILFILIALVVQYVADYLFLYQNYRDLWTAGGSNELIYLIAYFMMSLGLIQLNELNIQKK